MGDGKSKVDKKNTSQIHWIDWSKQKIVYLIVFILVYIVLIFLDRLLFYNLRIIEIQNYYEVCLAFWQVQTTVATLSVLGLSIFTNIINSKIYGIKYSEIVAQSISFLGFSYWEIMILSIILIPMNIFGAVLGSMSSVIFIFVVNIIAVLVLINGSKKVLIDNKEINDFCKSLIMKSIESKDDHTKCFQYIKNLGAHTEELYQVKDLPTFEANLKLLHELLKISINQDQDQEMLLTHIQINLLEIYKKVVRQNESERIIEIFSETIDIERKYKKATRLPADYLTAILDQSYKNELDKVKNQSLLEKLTDQLIIQFNGDDGDITTNLILLFYRTLILNADEENFTYLTGRLFLVDNEKRKYDIMSVVCIYLYYLCFYSIEFQNYARKEGVEKLKGFIKVVPQYNPNNNQNLLSQILLYKDGFLNKYKLIKAKLNKDWEFRSQFVSVRIPNLGYAVVEFLNFIGQYYYPTWGNTESLCKFELDDLLQIYKYYEENGKMKKEGQERFEHYLNWIGVEKKHFQTGKFYGDICDVIYNKRVDYFKSRRENEKDIIKKNIDHYKLILLKELQNSPFNKDPQKKKSEQHIVKRIIQLDLFFDREKERNDNPIPDIRKEIEQQVIERNISCFEKIKVRPNGYDEDNYIQEILCAMDRLNSLDIKLDEYFNELISSKPYLLCNLEEKYITDQLKEIERDLKNKGELIDQHYHLYYDSSKLDISFSISNICIEDTIGAEDIDEELPNHQIDPDKDNFSFDIKGTNFFMDKPKASEYLSNAFIKIEVELEIIQGNEKCGLIIV